MAAHKQRAARVGRAQICTVAIFSLFTLCLAGCAVSNQASQQASNQAASMSLSPGSLTLQTGHSQQFTATVTGSSNTAVTWSATGGSISASGMYTAPTTAGNYEVKATSMVDTTMAAAATVTVTTTPVVAVTLSPLSASLQTNGTQQFTATVTGSSNPAVTWSASGGSISSSGLYTAPSAAGSFTIKATSVADTTKAASASVTVGGPAAQHTVTLTWTASTSSVVGYNVYRGTVSGGPYTKVNSVLEAASNYVDNTVQSGAQYFYVVTAEDASAAESVFSSQVSVAVPTP